MSNRLADLFPRPKMLTLGGGKWLVSQYRLKDLAFLESWLDSRRPDPMDDPRLAGDDRDARRVALRAAYEMEELPVPKLGSEEAAAAFATPEGAGWLVWLSLSQSNAGLTHADCVEIAVAMTTQEWEAFDRVAWAVDLLDEIDARINAECGIKLPESAREEGNLVKAFIDVNSHISMSLEDFGKLTISQWRAIASGGEKKDRCIPIPDGWTMDRFEDEFMSKRTAFFSTANPPAHPEDPGTAPAGA